MASGVAVTRLEKMHVGKLPCGILTPQSWISWIRLMKQIASLIEVDKAMCSALDIDNETVDCNLECQTMGQFVWKITCPVLDKHARGCSACSGVQFPAKLASTQATCQALGMIGLHDCSLFESSL